MSSTTPPTTEPRTVEHRELEVQPMTELLAGSLLFAPFAGDHVLAQAVDDLERDLDGAMRQYEQMNNDAILGGHVLKLKVDALEGGWSLVNPIDNPATTGDDEPRAKREFDKGERVRAWCEWNLKRLAFTQHRSFTSICWDMLSAIYLGHRIAEWTLEYSEDGPEGPGEALAKLKVKNRQVYAFALSNTNDLVAVVGRIAGNASSVLRIGLVGNATELPNAVSPSKFWMVRIDDVEDDPRGRSMFRKAYPYWFIKHKLLPERLKHGSQFGGGKITAELGEKTPSTVKMIQADGSMKDVPTTVAVQEQLNNLYNGRTAVFPHGVTVTIHPPAGDGKALKDTVDDCDKAMVMAVQLAVRETMEAKHGSRADSQTAQDVGDRVTNWLRGLLSESFHSVLYRLVEIRFGRKWADLYTPTLSFGRSSAGEEAAQLESYSKAGYSLHESQFESIDAKLGQPKRAEGWADRSKEQNEQPSNPDDLETNPGDRQPMGD